MVLHETPAPPGSWSVIFLHWPQKKRTVVIYLLGPNEKLYHIMHCFAFFPWFKGPFELPFSIKYTVGPLRSGIPNLVRIWTKVTKMVRNRSGIGHLTRSGFFWDAHGMTSTNVIMDRWVKYIYATTSFKVTNVCEQRAFLTGINVGCLIIFDCFLPFFTLLPLFLSI